MLSPFGCRAVRSTVSSLAAVALLLPVAAAAPLARAGGALQAVKAPKSGKYTGTTSEKGSVTFTVAKSRKTIGSFVTQLGYDGKCGQGGGPTFAVRVASMKIARGGHFSARTVGADNATKGTITISGVVSSKSAHGTIVEPKPFFVCSAPHQKVNPYAETFTAKTR